LRLEPLTVCLRYVSPDCYINESFFCFAIAPNLTGAGLSAQLLGILAETGIDKTNMVGQGYDGAGAMSGIDNGVQKHIRDICSSAIYVHCASHCLNLCLSKASSVPAIRSQ